MVPALSRSLTAPSAPVPEASKTTAEPTVSRKTKLFSCAALLSLTVAATLLTEASKDVSGSYPYNTFVLPLSVEAVKLLSSACVVFFSKSSNKGTPFIIAPSFLYCVPALCYFCSNNCMFYIIRELGPTTFQITNNLKILSTAILMRFVMSHRLTWTQVKALVLLVCGVLVTQLQPSSRPSQTGFQRRSAVTGYVAVCVNSLAAGLGGVYSERLLKGKATVHNESILWQNCQLYFFGVVFGLVYVIMQSEDGLENMYVGFNGAAVWTVFVLAACGLLVSFVLKYLDNFAKCFVNALSMMVVGAAHATTSDKGLQLPLVIGIVLTSIAVEQYNLS